MTGKSTKQKKKLKRRGKWPEENYADCTQNRHEYKRESICAGCRLSLQMARLRISKLTRCCDPMSEEEERTQRGAGFVRPHNMSSGRLSNSIHSLVGAQLWSKSTAKTLIVPAICCHVFKLGIIYRIKSLGFHYLPMRKILLFSSCFPFGTEPFRTCVYSIALSLSAHNRRR